MALAWIELRGDDIFCAAPEMGAEARFPIKGALARLKAWAERYDLASHEDREGELIEIGTEMFAWLDEAGWASDWIDAGGERHLEIRVPGRNSEQEALLLDSPWELLSTDRGPLAGDDLQLFVVARRIGAAGASWPPLHGDIQLMFMAASVEDQSLLAFEDEEAAILEATGGERTHLIVEETGALGPLGQRLTSDEGPFEALHLSCHGTIDQKKGPVLLLESLEGDATYARPGDLVDALGPTPPPLVVLSACRTAEHSTGLAAPFARQLATMVANVVGWDGSVYDRDAIAFAAEFYRDLERGGSVPRAAAQGRRALLRIRIDNPERGLHWHLARVYLGGGGGGPLCEAKKQRRRREADKTPRAFLDSARARVPIASRHAFVGRRRALQSILRAFRDGAPGVLVHGMGAVGKSSAAARIANRLSLSTCVIFEHYDGLTIFDVLVEMLPPVRRQSERETWREAVRHDEAVLAEALESWLTGPFDAGPILVIIDDLERILEAPAPGDVLTGVAVSHRRPLGAVLTAFSRANSRSRLLLTSRYDFSLPDGRGGDLAGGLFRQPLIAMPPQERAKQLRAAERIAGRDEAAQDGRTQELLARALDAGAGNPGLQDALTRPILSGELDAAELALAQIAYYHEAGVPPEEIQTLIDSGAAMDSDNALIAFLARVSFQTYRDALTGEEASQLAAATLFSEGVPIPLTALAAAGAALGCAAPSRAISRLMALGLLDNWGEIHGRAHAAANALARPLAPLAREKRPNLAHAALPALEEAWRGPTGDFPIDQRSVEFAELALLTDYSPEAIEASALAAAYWLRSVNLGPQRAFEVIAAAANELPPDYVANPDFLRIGAECADLLGEVEFVDSLLARPVRSPADEHDPESVNLARLDLKRAGRLMQLGRTNEAETLIRSALRSFQIHNDERSAAFAWGELANILQQRGETDEALRIRREEELPVYERLGDVRSRAVTMIQLADILHQRGETDEALRIRRDEQLPVFERIGDVRSLAITMGRIADVLEQRGETDEALRIRREEELPVYQRLGDVHSRAVTMGQIADILEKRGETDEALRIRREEALPVFERLGDVRSLAVTMGQIADILQQRGETDEALRIRKEQLPVFERLGDVRSRAVTMGKIADILEERGETDEALRIRREEELPVYKRLGDARSCSTALQKIASALMDRGGLGDERIEEIHTALTEAFGIAVRLRLPDGIGFVGVQLAQVLALLGQRQNAIEVLHAAEAAFRKLGQGDALAFAGTLRAQIMDAR